MLNEQITLESGTVIPAGMNEQEFTALLVSLSRNDVKALCPKLRDKVQWKSWPQSTRPLGIDLKRETCEEWAMRMFRGETSMPIPDYWNQARAEMAKAGSVAHMTEPEIEQAIARTIDPESVPDFTGESNRPEIPDLDDSDPDEDIEPEADSNDAAAHLQAAIEALCGRAKQGATAEQIEQINQNILVVNDRVNAVRADLQDQIDLQSKQITELQRKIEDSTRTLRIEIRDRETLAIMGIRHHGFDDLAADIVSFRDTGRTKDANFWLKGPAGTGKTTAAKKLAELLGLPFRFNGAIDSEYKLRGFIDAQGRIISTPFRMAYEHGGIYLFDEVDSSLPAACLAFNAALANGCYDFPQPDGNNLPIPRHNDCFCLAASNTWNGPSGGYVGRYQQDAAFLDRFMLVPWDTDEKLERALCERKDWCDYVQAVRKAVATNGIEAIVSPRATFNGDTMLQAGRPWERAVSLCVRKGISDADWTKIAAAVGRN